ncbi:intersectin-1 [Drosophila eugracilis]|uniref:intersectin-1 n=1 Tax=Drosophila eugracilis TaxID=29029 RepID=UPI0007E64B76|nr:intersectin-1 [Drosophila eugracilis]
MLIPTDRRQRSYIMDSSQAPKSKSSRDQDRKDRDQEGKARDQERKLRDEERKEQAQERKNEQERDRKRQQERRKEVEREKELEKQRQLEWKQDLEKERAREKELERDHSRHDTSTTAKKPNPEVTKFDEEFERDIEKLERNICPLDFRSKTMATMWMDKLRQTPQNVSEARSRNIITAHLIKCCGENIFNKEPFNHPPPPESLSAIREKMYLTRDSTCHGMPVAKQRDPNSHLTQLFNDCHDGGEFLSQLPVPRDGAFFILHLHPNL